MVVGYHGMVTMALFYEKMHFMCETWVIIWLAHPQAIMTWKRKYQGNL